MKKPEITLTQMEEEPETGFRGLTFTEVKSAFIRSFLVIVLFSILLSILYFDFENAIILSMFCGSGFFWFYTKKLSQNRSGKPLYYHRHVKMFRNPKLFIQPAKTYQRERTK